MDNEKSLPLSEHMERVKLAIKTNCNGTGFVDYFRLVINPDSFSLTVYNIFTVSFLLREGQVSVSIGLYIYIYTSKYK